MNTTSRQAYARPLKDNKAPSVSVELKKIISTEHKKAYTNNKNLGAKKLSDYQKYVKENLESLRKIIFLW